MRTLIILENKSLSGSMDLVDPLNAVTRNLGSFWGFDLSLNVK